MSKDFVEIFLETKQGLKIQWDTTVKREKYNSRTSRRQVKTKAEKLPPIVNYCHTIEQHACHAP